MSRDGYLPDGVEDWHIPGNRPQDQHFDECPCADDGPEYCVCGCPIAGHDLKDCGRCEGVKIDDNPDCICHDRTEYDW